MKSTEYYFNKYYSLLKPYTDADLNPNENKHAMAIVQNLLAEFIIELQKTIKEKNIHTSHGVNVVVDKLDKQWEELCERFNEADTHDILALNQYTFRAMVNNIVAKGRSERES